MSSHLHPLSIVPRRRPRRPEISRRAFLASVGIGAAVFTGAALYAGQVEPFWLDAHDNDVPLPTWPEALDGLRIAHLTDIHFDDKLPASYAADISRRVREELKPDLVVFTGDLTTHSRAYLPSAAQWLASFGAPTYACLGNHDYDPATSARVNCPESLADDLETLLRGTPVSLLRNASAKLTLSPDVAGRPRELYIAGVEDFYTGKVDPNRAVASIPSGAPRLMLCHNPDASPLVDAASAGGLILAGHTHGGQIRIPGYGHLMSNVMDETKMMGQFSLDHATLYVSRGVGYLLQAGSSAVPSFLCMSFGCEAPPQTPPSQDLRRNTVRIIDQLGMFDPRNVRPSKCSTLEVFDPRNIGPDGRRDAVPDTFPSEKGKDDAATVR